jgi:hypothetical protein
MKPSKRGSGADRIIPQPYGMENVRIKRVKFFLIFSVAIVLIFWLCDSESSPLYEYFLYHTSFPEVIGYLSFPAFFFSAILSGNIHAPDETIFYIAMIVQWMFVGWLISLVIYRGSKK